MADLKKILSDHNISPSLHRLKILEFISKPYSHPTVDDIFQALWKDIPTLSKTTVYNALKTFEESDLILSLPFFENETRYELKKKKHAHFKCEKCGEIIDLMNKFDIAEMQFIEGHLIQKHYIYFKGICKNCLQKGV